MNFAELIFAVHMPKWFCFEIWMGKGTGKFDNIFTSRYIFLTKEANTSIIPQEFQKYF